MKLFPKLDHGDWMFVYSVSALLIIPAIIGGFIGGCIANSDTNAQNDKLQDYVAAVSNRLERIEFGLSLFSIPVQPKESTHE